jgi:hypothetical protein
MSIQHVFALSNLSGVALTSTGGASATAGVAEDDAEAASSSANAKFPRKNSEISVGSAYRLTTHIVFSLSAEERQLEFMQLPRSQADANVIPIPIVCGKPLHCAIKLGYRKGVNDSGSFESATADDEMV